MAFPSGSFPHKHGTIHSKASRGESKSAPKKASNAAATMKSVGSQALSGLKSTQAKQSGAIMHKQGPGVQGPPTPMQVSQIHPDPNSSVHYPKDKAGMVNPIQGLQNALKAGQAGSLARQIAMMGGADQ